MEDLEEFEALNWRQGARCTWPALIASLTPSDLSSLEQALATGRIQNTAIVRWLAARKVAVGKSSVARHRTSSGPTECVSCRKG